MTSRVLNNEIEQLMRWFCMRLNTELEPVTPSVIPTVCLFTVVRKNHAKDKVTTV